ncbi:MAG: hypothetical protein ACK4SU_01020 [Dictyoglomus sp.]
MNFKLPKIQYASKIFQKQIVKRILPEVGRIKIGKKRHLTKGNQTLHIPQKLDHFLITKNFKDESGDYAVDYNLMERVASVTGENSERLTKIPIILPFNSPDLNLQIWFLSPDERQEGRLYCKGDGEKALRREGDIFKVVECPCDRLDEGKCKWFGRLNCIIRDADFFGGVWVFRTTSSRTVETLWRQMELFKSMFGTLSGLVFTLTINPEKVFTPNGFQTIYTVNLLYIPEWDDLRNTVLGKIFERVKKLSLPREEIEKEEKIASLMAPVILEEEEKIVEEIQEEFFPKYSEVSELSQEESQHGEIQKEAEEVKEEKAIEGLVEPEKQTKPQKIDFQQRIDFQKEKLVSETQINIIKKQLGNYIKSQGRDPESDIYLEKVKDLTFKEATQLINLLREKKERYAYNMLIKFIKEKSKDIDSSSGLTKSKTSKLFDEIKILDELEEIDLSELEEENDII